MVKINGIEWPSREEFERIVRIEFSKLDKDSTNYENDLEVKRSFYGIPKKELSKYL